MEDGVHTSENGEQNEQPGTEPLWATPLSRRHDELARPVSWLKPLQLVVRRALRRGRSCVPYPCARGQLAADGAAPIRRPGLGRCVDHLRYQGASSRCVVPVVLSAPWNGGAAEKARRFQRRLTARLLGCLAPRCVHPDGQSEPQPPRS